MWEYLTKDSLKEFILSLDLIQGDLSDNKKLNLLYAIANNNKKYYTKKYINKKDGTKRELLVPNKVLKSIQKNILNNVLYGLNTSDYGCAYKKGVSLKENAKSHVGKKMILKLDIKSFFSNVTFEMLYKALPKEVLPPSVKVLILKLCTYDDYLPQGAPTSPYLSNLALKYFDEYIGKYCSARNISYTRYSDDLTFSGDFDSKKLKNKVETFLEELGFNLNKEKTRVIKQGSRQIITGVIVNEKINTPKSYRKKIRQEIYYIKKYGIESYTNRIKEEKESYLLSFKGRINFCLSINKNDKEMIEYKNYLDKI